MIAGLVCGAGVGAGLWLVVRGLFPPRPSLAQALAALRRPPTPRPVIDTQTGADQTSVGFAGRLGRPAARWVEHAGGGWLVLPGVRRDLVVLGRGVEQHLAEKITLALAGLLLAPAVTALVAVEGIAISVVVPVWAALVLMAAGFIVPDLGVHADATKRRRDFRHALSSFLDLTVIGLAGGGGVETALHDAATVGSGWQFHLLRQALGQSRLLREPPWGPLGRLGAELGVAELVELAASVSLAGAEGAKVRASLMAKAVSLRVHELAEAETAEQAASERMSLPVVLLFAGFLVFIAYPAIHRVLTGL